MARSFEKRVRKIFRTKTMESSGSTYKREEDCWLLAVLGRAFLYYKQETNKANAGISNIRSRTRTTTSSNSRRPVHAVHAGSKQTPGSFWSTLKQHRPKTQQISFICRFARFLSRDAYSLFSPFPLRISQMYVLCTCLLYTSPSPRDS